MTTAPNPNDPDSGVAETLQWLSEGLGAGDPYPWSVGTCAAVLEALEDAVRPHRQYDDPYGALEDGDPGWCSLDGEPWPCPTVRQVADNLRELDR